MFTGKKTTEERLLPFYNKLKNAWCKKSCSPSLLENWPNGNIAKEQCFVTAVAVRDAFGGEVLSSTFPKKRSTATMLLMEKL